ncbi:MAG: hypothetical protein WAW82_13695, partial [Candidatus Lutibacillus vidarii]
MTTTLSLPSLVRPAALVGVTLLTLRAFRARRRSQRLPPHGSLSPRRRLQVSKRRAQRRLGA